MKKVRVYYEDSGDPTDFSLHNLVLACVAGRLHDPAIYYRSLYMMFEAHPAKGRDHVLEECRITVPDLPSHYLLAVAVIDGDKIHRGLALPSGSKMATLRERFAATFASHGRAELFVICDNTETVLSATARILGDPYLKIDIPKKRLHERDRLLNAGAARADVHEAVLDEVPSLRRLVTRLTELYPICTR